MFSKNQKALSFFIAAGVLLVTLLWYSLKQDKNMPLNIPVPTINLNQDPHQMEDMYSMFLAVQLYRGLFRYFPDGEVEKDIADSWSWDNDKTQLTIRLARRNFSDGTAIEAEHVRSSLLRIFIKGASIGADMSYIRGISDFAKTKDINSIDIKTVDKTTLTIGVNKPTTMLIKHLATVDCAILPILAPNQPLNDSDPVSGPYYIVSKSNERIILKIRDDINSASSPGEVHLIYVPKSKISEELLRLNLDTVETYSVSDIDEDRLIKAGWKKSVSSIASENFVLINSQALPKKIRKRMMALVDQESLVKDLPWHWLTPAYGMIPPFMAGSLEARYVIEDDKSSSYTKIRIQYYGESGTLPIVAEKLKKLWSPIFNSIELVPLNADDYFDRLFSKKADVIVAAKGIDYPDGYSNIAYFKSNVKSNYFYTENSSQDKYIENLPFQPEEERIKSMQTIQKKLLDQNTFIPLFFGNTYASLWSTKVIMVPDHPLGFHFLPLETLRME